MNLKKLIASCALALSMLAGHAVAQQPQTQQAPLFAFNAKYVNGVAPGYAPCGTVNGVTSINCQSITGLNVQIGLGTCNLLGSIITYSGGTFSLSPSTTTYVYLNTSSSCAVSTKTTAFVGTDIPIATIVTGSSGITSIADDRTVFSVNSTGGSGSVSGQATGVVPLATGATAIGAQSHIDDGVTSAGNVTSSEPIVTPSIDDNQSTPKVSVDPVNRVLKDGSGNTIVQWANKNNVLFGNTAGARLGSSADNNVFLGEFAGDCSGYNGLYNIAIGYFSNFGGCTTNASSQNIAVGYETLYHMTTSIGNIAIGDTAGFGITSGSFNVLLGYQTGDSLTSDGDNVFIGNGAGLSQAGAAAANVFIGYNSGGSNATGVANTAVGNASMYGVPGQSNTSIRNTAIGAEALASVTTGFNNVAVGSETMSWNTPLTGNDNAALGNFSGGARSISPTPNVSYMACPVTATNTNQTFTITCVVPKPPSISGGVDAASNVYYLMDFTNRYTSGNTSGDLTIPPITTYNPTTGVVLLSAALTNTVHINDVVWIFGGGGALGYTVAKVTTANTGSTFTTNFSTNLPTVTAGSPSFSVADVTTNSNYFPYITTYVQGTGVITLSYAIAPTPAVGDIIQVFYPMTYTTSVFLGNDSGGSLNTGSGDVFLGFRSGSWLQNISNTLVIDNQDRGPANDLTSALVVGTFSSTPQNQNLRVNGTLQDGFTYSATGVPLPTCNSGSVNTKAVVSDATSPTYLGTYSSGGTVIAPVMCNGTNWITY